MGALRPKGKSERYDVAPFDRRYPMRPLSLLAAPLLFASAFVLAQDAAHPAAHAGVARTQAPAGAEVFIIEPQDGATVGREVAVKFGARGIAIKPAGDMTPGSGHHHLLIDVAELPPGDAPVPADAHHKHYGKGQTEDTITLEPGTHTLQLDLGDAAHMQFDPPIVSKKITIHVR
jgi:hypothetical protein